MTYIPCPISHVLYPMSYIPCPISHVLYPCHPMYYIPYPLITCPIPCPIFHIPYPIPHIACTISHIPYPISHILYPIMQVPNACNDSAVCGENGTCKVNDGNIDGFVCKCDPGFKGKYCNVSFI